MLSHIILCDLLLSAVCVSLPKGDQWVQPADPKVRKNLGPVCQAGDSRDCIGHMSEKHAHCQKQL